MRIPFKALAIASAATLLSAPVVVQAQASEPASTSSFQGDGFMSTGAIFGAIGGVAVLVALVFLIQDDDDNDNPVSP